MSDEKKKISISDVVKISTAIEDRFFADAFTTKLSAGFNPADIQREILHEASRVMNSTTSTKTCIDRLPDGGMYLFEEVEIRSDPARYNYAGYRGLYDDVMTIRYENSGYRRNRIIRMTLDSDEYSKIMHAVRTLLENQLLKSAQKKEEDRRKSNPAVQDAWEAYQFVLNTCG